MPTLTLDTDTGFYTKAVDANGEVLGNLTNVHSPSNCDGRGCAVHGHPSDHVLKDAPMYWRADRGILERICEHGVGHPDHDSAEFLSSIGRDYENVHGCDGCCMSATKRSVLFPEPDEAVQELAPADEVAIAMAYYKWRQDSTGSQHDISRKDAFFAGVKYAQEKGQSND